MNANKLIAFLAIPALVIAIPLAASLYTVKEGKQVIITQFGKPVGNPKTTAGLKIKIPFIQDVNVLESRILEWDGSPTDMPNWLATMVRRRSAGTLLFIAAAS